MAKKKTAQTPRRSVEGELIVARNELAHLKGVLEAECKKQHEQELDFNQRRTEWGRRVSLACETAKDFSEKLKRAQSLIDEDDLNISVLLGEIARLQNQLQQQAQKLDH